MAVVVLAVASVVMAVAILGPAFAAMVMMVEGFAGHITRKQHQRPGALVSTYVHSEAHIPANIDDCEQGAGYGSERLFHRSKSKEILLYLQVTNVLQIITQHTI